MVDLNDARQEFQQRRRERGLFYGANQLARSISQGATLGFGDELAAAGDAAIAQVAGDERPFSEIYPERLARERALLEEFQRNSPVTSLTGQLTGAVATGMGTGPLVARQLGRLLPNLATGVGAGAVEGAVAGFGSGEGGAVNRAANAVPGAVLGGGLGAAGQGLASAFRRAMAMRAGNMLSEPRRLAAQRLQEAIGDRLPAIERRLRGSNRPLVPADVGGGRVSDLADTVLQSRTDASRAARTTLNQRQMGQQGRLAADLDRVAPDAAYMRPVDDLLEEWRSTNLYRDLPMDDVIDGADEVSDILFRRPIYKAAFDRAKQDATDFGERLIDPFEGNRPVTLRALDSIKKELDDQIGVAKRAGRNNEVARLTRAKNELVESVDSLSPEYAAARAKWANEEGMREAAEQGEKFRRMSPAEIRQFMEGATPEQQAMFRAGAVRSTRETMDKAKDTSDRVRLLFDSNYKRDQFRETFGADSRAIGRDILDEARMSRTRRALGGSATASRQAGQRQLVEESGAQIPADVLSGEPVNAGIQMLRSLFRRNMRTLEPEVAESLARVLFERNPERAIRLIQQMDAQANMSNVLDVIGSPSGTGRVSGAFGAAAPIGVEAMLNGRGNTR